jgi:hypothetical protein
VRSTSMPLATSSTAGVTHFELALVKALLMPAMGRESALRGNFPETASRTQRRRAKLRRRWKRKEGEAVPSHISLANLATGWARTTSPESNPVDIPRSLNSFRSIDATSSHARKLLLNSMKLDRRSREPSRTKRSTIGVHLAPAPEPAPGSTPWLHEVSEEYEDVTVTEQDSPRLGQPAPTRGC